MTLRRLLRPWCLLVGHKATPWRLDFGFTLIAKEGWCRHVGVEPCARCGASVAVETSVKPTGPDVVWIKRVVVEEP